MGQSADIDHLADELERAFSGFVSTQNSPCLEPIHPFSQPLKLRASASEFVPQSDSQLDSHLAKESEDDSSYDFQSQSDASEYGNNSTNNRTKDGKSSNPKNYLYEKQRPNQNSPCCSSNTEKSSPQPPPQLANGLPHFKGPYMPLLRHRMSNAKAYGMINGPNCFNYNSLLLQDLVQQLSRLESFKDLNSLSIDLFNQSFSQDAKVN